MLMVEQRLQIFRTSPAPMSCSVKRCVQFFMTDSSSRNRRAHRREWTSRDMT